MTPLPASRLRWRRLPAPRRGRRLSAGLAFLALFLCASGQTRDPTLTPPPDSGDISGSVMVPAPGQHEVLPASPRAVLPGESLRFSVRYGFIHAGSAWLEVPQVRQWKGHDVYELVARAESNAFFSRFYKVRERIVSLWDYEGRFSRHYMEDRREGKFRQRNDIAFEAERGLAVYSDGRSFPVPPRVQDALSSFYYARIQALPVGGSIVFHYHASRKSQPLQVRILGRERIKTPAGSFDCVAVEPILKAGGIFKNSGRLVIWLTDDERRMPVLVKSKVVIGSVSVVLEEVRAGT